MPQNRNQFSSHSPPLSPLQASDPLLPDCLAVHHVAAVSIPDSNWMGAAQRHSPSFTLCCEYISRLYRKVHVMWVYVCINISTATVEKQMFTLLILNRELCLRELSYWN